MKNTKLYKADINLEEHWQRAEEFDIDGASSSAILTGEFFDETALEFPGARFNGNKDIGISYIQMAKIQSRLGYDDPFFSTSRYDGLHCRQDFLGLQYLICIGKFNYDWMRNFVDGDLAAKKIRDFAKKINKQADALHDLIYEFSDYYHIIKANGIYTDTSILTGISNKATEHDWSSRFQIYESLDELCKLCRTTTAEFKSTGGAPHKYARSWLIMEAAIIYEEWNVNEERAGVSFDRKTGIADGPFVRFLDTFFGIIDGNSPSLISGEVKNSGLATEASKILKYLREHRMIGFHRNISPHLSPSDLVRLLKELIAYRS